MCYSGRCRYEDHEGNCTWDGPRGTWPDECSIYDVPPDELERVVELPDEEEKVMR